MTTAVHPCCPACGLQPQSVTYSAEPYTITPGYEVPHATFLPEVTISVYRCACGEEWRNPESNE